MQVRSTLYHSLQFLCLGVISVTIALCQNPALSLATKPAPPVAYVYVSKQPTDTSPNQVLGYSVSSNGKLTPIVGSPFQADVSLMAVNGKYLFGGKSFALNGTGNDGHIDTYKIAANGVLGYVVSNQTSVVDEGYYYRLFLDHTGAHLYGEMGYETGAALGSLDIDKQTGTLALTQGLDLGRWGLADITVSANNKYLYVVEQDFGGNWVATVPLGSDGAPLAVSSWRRSPDYPVAKPTLYYSPVAITADPSNHVAVAMQVLSGPDQGAGANVPAQLGVYTADAKGNLTTTSTYKNMPTLPLFGYDGPTSMKLSPSGKLLAISGWQGLQVFHFNGANPITPYATLVKNSSFTVGPLKQLGWDNHDHLFAAFANKLYVFTVTPTSITQAPGSPYSIPGNPGAQYLIVQPLL